MPAVTLNFAGDVDLQRVIDAFCADGGWNADTGLPRAAFAKQYLAAMVRRRVTDIEREQARRAALAGVTAPAEPDVT